MKQFTIILSIILFVLTAFWSCNKLEDVLPSIEKVEVLEENRFIDDLILPKGTRVKQVSDARIDFTLPKGLKFLVLTADDEIVLRSSGSYSCTCSKTGSCTVFWNENTGYGCLQSTCSGSCTGKRSEGNENFIGVIDESNDALVTAAETPTGYLTEMGYEAFFERIAYNKVKEHYDFIYGSQNIETTEELIDKYGSNVEYLHVQYLGVQFSLLVPSFEDEKEDQLIELRSGPTVTCTGSDGCTCIKSRKCILGNCVYYCTGCTTCTMNVDPEK